MADQLIKYLQQDNGANHPMVLSDQEQLELERIDYADAQLRRGYSPKQVRNMLIKHFINPDTGKNISQDTAYRIMKRCNRVHGEVGAMTKEYMRELVLEMILKSYRLAVDMKDVKSQLLATKQLKDLFAIGEKEPDSIPAGLINNIQLNFVSNPEEVGIQTVPFERLEKLHLEVMGKPLPKTLIIDSNDD